MNTGLRNVFYVVALLCFCFCFEASAQQNTDYSIRLKRTTIIPEKNGASWINNFHSSSYTTPQQFIIQFYEIPSAAIRRQIENAGILLKDFVGGNAFIAILSSDAQLNQLPQNAIRSVISFQPGWKIEFSLSLSGSAVKQVAILWYADVNTNQLLQIVAANGGMVIDKKMFHLNAATISIPANKILSLANWYGIKYISPVSEHIDLNFETRNATKINTGGIPVSLGGPGLYGDSMTVGVGDNVSGLYHIDLKDRITNFNPSPYTNHGQHINGIVGGAGTIDPKGEGMAPHVKLLDHLYDLVWQQTEAMRQTYNMTLTNNSYAAIVGDCNYAGVYDIYSAILDNVARGYTDVLHVFAAGNDGNMSCSPYPQGFATVTGTYQAAKNVIVVGNNTKWFQNYSGSSRGPVKDGRLKPEISAIGTNVYSTRGIDDYLSAGGTSMASPNVVGAATLLSQRYKQLHANAYPRADVLKTIILNGATDYGNPGPDYSFGFGMLNFYRSLQMLENNRYTTNTIANGAQQTLQINVPANTSQLKVMLYWNDTAANPAILNTLVNDLDLEVTEPSNTVHHPLILDATPSNVTNNATEGIDHKNNVEQVTINNPAAGSYTITVKGFSIPLLQQNYVVAYDFIPTGMQFTYPIADASWPASDSLRIYWEASNDPNNYTLEFSQNNGGSWSVVANNIPANQKYYTWYTPNISSEQCKLRLTRNGNQIISSSFVISPQATVQLSTIQCPGYMAINWNAVPNATGYQVLMKKGYYLQAVDTVSSLNYTFSGLSLDSTYYTTIRPFVNGVLGWRSIAVKRKPNDGNCTGNISNGDLMIEKIINPGSGRLNTSTALTNNQTISVVVRNLDDAPVNNYIIFSQVNGGGWTGQIFSTPLPANSATTITLNHPYDLSATGSYQLMTSIQNLSSTDPVHSNDSVRKTVRQLNNAPIDLNVGFTEDFETAGVGQYIVDTMGVTPNEYWDFVNATDSGRLRFLISPDISITGNRSASMDAFIYTPGNQNYLYGSFNLAAYDTAIDEARLEFDYKLHGRPKFEDGNQVWIRGNDQLPWIKIFTFDTMQNQGQIINSSSLSLTNTLHINGQNFSSSFQVRFGQNDTSVIAANDYGNGLTIDNVKLYTVKNDVQLLSIVQPSLSGCGFGSNEQLKIKVYNGFNQPQANVDLYYQLDNGAIMNAVLSSIAAKDTVVYIFSQTMDLSALGMHSLNVWLSANGDTYHNNDSILNYKFHNQPYITTFPYLQQFESSDGYWYSEGKNNSWAYGVIAAPKIHKAASGTKGWKTSLAGNYSNSEKSYLYSPCFDVSSLQHPMLSFSAAMNIENCGGAICDQAYLEYALNDTEWTRLGVAGQGTNWYDSFGVWREQNFTRWHVVSISLPSAGRLKLRFVFISDSGASFEGLAVDDIHIFDRKHDVFENGEAASSMNVLQNQSIDFLQTDKWLAQISGQQDLGNAEVKLYEHTKLFDDISSQYYFPKNFTIKTATTLSNEVSVKLFIAESDMKKLVEDNSCPDCSKPEDAYSMGITQYSDADTTKENGILNDNKDGSYQFHPVKEIDWVPYDNGYYAAIKLHSFSELWFNDGGALNNLPLTKAAVELFADKKDETHAAIKWISNIDTSLWQYVLERSYDNSTFTELYTVNAVHMVGAEYNYTDTPAISKGASVYYRVKYALPNAKEYFTAVKKIDWTEAGQLIGIYPNPVTQHQFTVQWSAGTAKEMQVAIFDLLGRKIYAQSFAATGWNNSTIIKIPVVGTGLYVVKLMIDKNHYEKKMLMQ